MSQEIQVGTILIKKSPLMTRSLGLETQPCSENWSLVKLLDGSVLDRKIHTAGWSFFFMAAEVKAMFFGAIGAQKIQNALRRILGKMKGEEFNCLEVTGITAQRFLGVPYTVVTAHSRHLQQSCYLDSAEARRAAP